MKLLMLTVLMLFCLVSSAFSGNVDVYDIELQTGKLVKNGQLITANVVTSFRPLTNKILKDLALTTLDELKNNYPNCQWFHIFISDDRSMLEATNHLVVADYKEGKTEINGGVLSDAEIKEYRKEGIPVIKPDKIGIKIFAEINRIKVEYFKKGKYLTDPELYKIVSKKMKIPVATVTKYHKGVGWYYMAKMNSVL